MPFSNVADIGLDTLVSPHLVFQSQFLYDSVCFGDVGRIYSDHQRSLWYLLINFSFGYHFQLW